MKIDRFSYLPTVIRACLLGCALFLLASCGLVKQSWNQSQSRQMGEVSGAVYVSHGEKSHLVVVAMPSEQTHSAPLREYQLLDGPGNYALALAAGNYLLFAFEDSNQNLTFDQDELHTRESVPLSIQAGKTIQLPPLYVEDSQTPPANQETQLAARSSTRYQATNAGAIAKLSDYVFSTEYAADKGYWEGLKFNQEVGNNIYFLDAFDPNRIPVLFLHGVRGSPQDLAFLMKSIDQKKYQPWVYYYASGPSMRLASEALHHKLSELQSKYHFPKMHLVAYSAGGLVARDMLIQHGEAHRYIQSFISISTPWGGEKMAENGVRYSPVVLPSWVEMQPSGAFIQSLFAKKLPSWIDYHLLFSYQGKTNRNGDNTDGAVTLASILDKRAQNEAKTIFAFNENHESILQDQLACDRVNDLLDQADNEDDLIARGNLQLELKSFTPLQLVAMGVEITLKDQAGHRTTLPIYPGLTSQTIPQLAVGEYQIITRSKQGNSEQVISAPVINGRTTQIEIQMSGGLIKTALRMASPDATHMTSR
ncbi:alpha/beta hydrolase [Leeia sp. TBRC 13508]|uniref:Alpha/beta hydrolase n=1 Tax=Leeia speluncae TaxID=2884804 RepID=A0ABS8D7N0_9NEIS|nr:alpha/beta hydrolase [Leeia speluncae]MCB6184209.1 alpha/beta hydrolase [Leeia speluncae]